MAGSEAAGVDLYNGLAELLGRERAETLMAALPGYDMSDLPTKSDLAERGSMGWNPDLPVWKAS